MKIAYSSLIVGLLISTNIFGVIAPWYTMGIAVELNKEHVDPAYQAIVNSKLIGGPTISFVICGIRYSKEQRGYRPTGKLVRGDQVLEPYVELYSLNPNKPVDHETIVAFIHDSKLIKDLFGIKPIKTIHPIQLKGWNSTEPAIIPNQFGLKKIGTAETWVKEWNDDHRAYYSN